MSILPNPQQPKNNPGDVICAVDIGGTKIAAGLVSADGRILARGATPTDPRAGFEAAIQRFSGLYAGLCAQIGRRPVGIGIGCTGPIDPHSGVFGHVDTLPGWDGCGLTAALSAVTGLACAVENDADAHAVGEAIHGSGAGADPFLMITIGTGIGSALILGRKIYRGVGGSHPEMGHQTLEAQGLACVCGARGCWEGLAAGPAWEAWFRQANPDLASWGGREICAAARAGDPRAQAAVLREGFYLGAGLANLINLFAPQVIALGGGMMEQFDLFEAAIRAEIRSRCVYIPHEQVCLGPARLGTDAGLLGAAEVWKQRNE